MARQGATQNASRPWQLSFAVPQHLLPPFEEAFADAADAILTTAIAPGTLWRVEALFSDPPDLEAWRRRLSAVAASQDLPPPDIELRQLPDVDWVAESLKALPAIRAGRLFVHGSHDANRIPTGCLPLRIDAGRAFGTGQHETTHGCLLALDQLRRRYRFRRILDLGCGSGVLGLAAARLWRVPVLASEIDPHAVKTAEANARLNGLRPYLQVIGADGLDHPAIRRSTPYDLVLANILAGPLVYLAPAIDAVVGRSGVVVLSGILTKQERQVLNTYRSFGFVLGRRIRLGDWPTLILRRPGRRPR